MRLLIRYVSLAGIVLGLYLLYSLLWSTPTAYAFATFPVGVERLVELEVNRGAFRGQTAEERLNQARDWLLYTAVASAGLTAEEISQRLFDVPVVRSDYLQQVTEFRYGPARSCDIGGGTLLALLPPESATGPEERQRQLLRMADEYRKDMGVTPLAVVPFDYVLDSDGGSGNKTARLTRREAISGKSLFTAGGGYHEATVSDPESLAAFLSRIDDLTVARIDSSYFGGLRLTLGGRRVKGREVRGLDVEEVSAVWQFAAAYPWKETWERESELNPEYDTLDRDVAKLPPAFALEPTIAPQKWDAAYHSAAYGQHLAGTKAGMTLFYTDLLTKLWALDFLSGQPEPLVRELHARPDAPVPPMYWPEISAAPHIRTRLGHLETGVLEEPDQLVFAPGVIKLDATSSAAYQHDKQQAVNPHGAAFLRWWERHREELYRFEPEFARLNQMLKWKLLAVWLHRVGEERRLHFLTSVPKQQDLWFPDWAPRQSHLRFKDWARLGFNPRGFEGAEAESLAPLQTTLLPRQPVPSILSGAIWQRGRGGGSRGGSRGGSGGSSGGSSRGGSGGGSGGRTSSSVGGRVGKGGVRVSSKTTPRGLFGKAKTIFSDKIPLRKPKPNVNHAFTNDGPNRALLKMTAGGAALRGHSGEFSTRHSVERSVAREGAAVTVEAHAGGARIGSLKIEPTANGFRVGWQSRDVNMAQSLARRLSRSKEPPEAVLGRDPNVEAVIKMEGQDGYFVKMLGADGWTRLTPSGRPGGSGYQSWDARVSASGTNAREVQIQWHEASNLAGRLNENSYLVAAHAEQSGAGAVMTQSYTPPPKGATVVEHPTPYGTVRIHTEAGGQRTYVSVRDLPPALREDPARLARVLSAQRRQVPNPGLDNPFARQVQNKAYREAAGDIARDPRAFKQHLDRHYKEGLGDCDRLLRDGHAEHALYRADELIGVYGRRPELLLVRGVAQLRGRQAEEAARSLEMAVRLGEAKRGAAFYDEVNARLAQSGGDDGALVLAREGEAASLHYNLKTQPPREAVPVDSIGARNSLIYVEDNPAFKRLIQDAPGLNNLDWYPSVKTSIQQAVESGQAVVVKLPRGGIADFQPTVVYAPDKATQYLAVARTRPTQRFYIPVRTGSRVSVAGDDDDEEEEPDDGPPEVYLILAAPARVGAVGR